MFVFYMSLPQLLLFSQFIPQGCFKTPAPSAYYRERVHPQGERKAPVYSMGSRTKYRKSKYSGFQSCVRIFYGSVWFVRAIGSYFLHRKNRFVMLTMKVCYLRCIILVHIKVTNFLVEMTNFHVTLTEECGDAPLITYLFLLCMACTNHTLPLFERNLNSLYGNYFISISNQPCK